jgi:hypothetical protein
VAPPARAVYAVKKAAPGAPPPLPASLGAIPKKTRVGKLHNYSYFSPVPGTYPQIFWQIRIQHFKILFDQKFQFTYFKASGEAFSPQKRTSSNSNN